jgi:hypothetical protein
MYKNRSITKYNYGKKYIIQKPVKRADMIPYGGRRGNLTSHVDHRENKQKIIYCQFCRKYYYPIYFNNHLQHCQEYIKYNKYNTNKQYIQNNNIRSLTQLQSPLRTQPRQSIHMQNNSHFIQLIKNKKVIIVGPSATIQDCNLGKFIESFDIVIRLNKSLPIPPRLNTHIGSRTDILYNSLNQTDYPGENNINPVFLVRNNVKFLRCPYPPITPFKYDIQAFQNKNRNSIPFGHIDQEYYRKMRYSLQTRPYTGTSAIADLLHSGVGELYVMGIDFYTYSYSSYYRKVSSKKLERMRDNNIHKRTPQINLIKRFYLLDKRLVVDNILDKILLEEYDILFYNIKTQVDFSKIFITASEKYISDSSTLMKLYNKLNKKRKNSSSLTSIGIISNTNIDKNFDFIINTCPNKTSNADLSVFISLDDWESNHKKSSESISLITQSYKRSQGSSQNPNIYKGFDADNIIYLNPLFSKYLKTILTKTVVPEGKISTEIFLSLLFSAFFSEKASIHLCGIDPYSKWNYHPASKRQDAIAQRMLYLYLLKREFISL